MASLRSLCVAGYFTTRCEDVLLSYLACLRHLIVFNKEMNSQQPITRKERIGRTPRQRVGTLGRREADLLARHIRHYGGEITAMLEEAD